MALLTFSFDDGFKDTLRAAHIMGRHGFRGSVGLVDELVRKGSDLTVEDALGLQESGWEICSHGRTHRDMTGLPFRYEDETGVGPSAERELEESKSALVELGFRIETFIAPFSHWTDGLGDLALKYYRAAAANDDGWYINSLPPENPGHLRRRAVLAKHDTARVLKWVNEAIASDKWLILMLHSIVENPDTDPYTWPSTRLEELAGAVSRLPIRVVTIREGMEMSK